MLSNRIDSLEKMLSRMDVEGRQKYAANNMDDPIAVLTALYVNNEDKKQKLSRQGVSEIKNPVVPQAIQAMTQPDMPPQGPQQGPPQGMPPQGMPPQGMPPQGMPPQGMPPPQGQPQMAADGGYMDSRLPEDMGIGALPERSLSNMADGGIVGFNEGGDVQRFQSGGTPKPRPMYPGMIAQEGELLFPGKTGYEGMGILEFIQKFGVDAYNKIKNAIPGESTEERQARQKQEVYDATPSGQRDKAMAEVNKPTPVNSTDLPPRPLGPYGAPTVPRQEGVLPDQAGAAPPAAPPAAPAAPPPAAAPRPPAALPAARPAAGAPTGAPPAAATGIQTLVTKDLTPEDIADARKKFTDKQPAVVDTLKDQRQALVDEKNKNAEAEFTGFKERMAKQGDPYAKQEERANKQEASVAESAERNPYLALMEAGFAMMSGDSPYAMVNIGKGALVGTKTYREGLTQLEKAKEKLSETRDRIDGLRLIRSDLNDKEERDIQRETRRTALEGKTVLFDALEKLTGESKVQVENNVKMFMEAETARRLAERQYNTEVMKQREETARNSASNAAAGVRNTASLAMQEKIAGMPSKEAQMAVSLGTGTTYEERLKSGLQIVQELSENPKTVIQAYTKHVEDARKAIPPETPLTPEAFATQTRALLAAMKNKGNPQDEALVNKYAPKQ